MVFLEKPRAFKVPICVLCFEVSLVIVLTIPRQATARKIVGNTVARTSLEFSAPT